MVTQGPGNGKRENGKPQLREPETISKELETAYTDGLLDFLADLPLAIKQASVYMARTGTTTARYLDHCRSSDMTVIKLLSQGFEDRSRYISVGNAVATTWVISFERIARNALAARYLRFMCFLEKKEIPTALLPPGGDELEVDEAMGTLKAYAFITQRDGQDSFDIHRLVRLVMRNWLDEKGQLQECRVSVVRRLAEVFPFPVHENREVWMRYLPHAQTALKCGDDATGGGSDLLFKVATSYYILGKYEEAEAMHRQALELRHRVFGKENLSTLSSMNNLAAVLYSLGKYQEAEAMYRQTLELTQRVLGKEHPSTLASMNNLANVLDRLGRYEEAEAMYGEALEGYEMVLGKEHHGTVRCRDNSASYVGRRGS